MAEKTRPFRIALAGNPNTGKSTVFNALTGLKQHTGNWSGKTVGNAVGSFTLDGREAALYDLPGIYSLFSDSAEESAAREFLATERPDLVIVILDATSLERNLPLGLQAMELTENIVFCLNLTDEAQKKGIRIDIALLEAETGVPVIETAARQGVGLEKLKETLSDILEGRRTVRPIRTAFRDMPQSFAYLTESCAALVPEGMSRNFFCGCLLEGDVSALAECAGRQRLGFWEKQELCMRAEAAALLARENGSGEVADFLEKRSLAFLERAAEISAHVVQKKSARDVATERIDRFVLSPKTGVPLMLLLLGGVFWITAAGANVPSDLLMDGFRHLGVELREGLAALQIPSWLESLLMDGVYLTVSWVVAVMLPPMAIFFPLFTLLEDFGLLPRIAFNLDGLFQRAGAHGKQALTMCMGFGCNAAGVTACRIIESPRERLIAILTNCLVPCNGRFPTLILLSGYFFARGNPIAAGGFVCLLIVLAAALTLGVSFLLSRTLLRGIPSSFVLELPPYRRPKIRDVVVRSVLDRTAFVLGRAVTFAIPAGAVIWLFQNVDWNGHSLLYALSAFLEPLGRLMGLSGVILAAFLLGIPANEIVIPILLMVYSQSGMLVEAEGMAQAGEIFAANGWTWVTAACAVLFSLNHFPCATTLLTIRKETGSRFWTVVAFLLPTAVGIALCLLVNGIAALFGL